VPGSWLKIAIVLAGFIIETSILEMHLLIKFQEMSLSKEQMAVQGKT